MVSKDVASTTHETAITRAHSTSVLRLPSDHNGNPDSSAPMAAPTERMLATHLFSGGACSKWYHGSCSMEGMAAEAKPRVVPAAHEQRQAVTMALAWWPRAPPVST